MSTLPLSNASIATLDQAIASGLRNGSADLLGPLLSASRVQGFDAGTLASYVAAHPDAREAIYAQLLGSDPGMISQVESTLAADSTLLAQATAPTSPTRIVGGDIGAQARSGLERQLQFESRLNGGTYGEQLADAAAQVQGDRRLVDGSYSLAANSRDRLEPSGRNALAVRTYSGNADAAVARVAQFDQEIVQARADRNIAVVEGANPFANREQREQANQRAADAQIRLWTAQYQRDWFINDARLQSGRTQDGQMYQAVANSADADRVPVIFVNGVNTDINRARLQALELSSEFRSPVNHIVNVSSKDKMVRAGLGIGVGGALLERQSTTQFDQRVQQHLSGNRPAAITTANAILDQLLDPGMRAANTPVKVVGYSQGAAIAGQALRDVDSYLGSLVNAGHITQADKVQMLERVRFLGVGPGSAQRHITQDYHTGGVIAQRPDLANVNYRIIADRNDQIANLVGVGEATPNAQRSAAAATRLAQNDFHAHLSYFRSYEVADPGSRYNPAVRTELHNWFSGASVTGLRTTELR